MARIHDYRGEFIRLTDERLSHIQEVHPELADAPEMIRATVDTPNRVIQSRSDPDARLYYRFYEATRVGDKFLCVVVVFGADPFVLTAYLTDRPRKGDTLWESG